MEKRFLLPGEYHATTQSMEMMTVLGSCVAVCLFNSRNGSAAMNHFVHARANGNADKGQYGDTATTHIVETLLALDADARHLRAQMFGGGNILTNSEIGQRNIKVAEETLDRYNIPIVRREVGGSSGCRICFNTATSKVTLEHTKKRAKSTNPDIKVLIVDDSPVVRKLLNSVIDSAPGFRVVGLAEDAYKARELLVTTQADVMTLDIIMPKMDGLNFLNRVITHFPTPVVIISTIAKAHSPIARKAKSIGAMDVIDKDTLELYKGLDRVKSVVLPKLREAYLRGPRREAPATTEAVG